MENQKVNEESIKQVEEEKVIEKRQIEKKLDIIGWGLFFIWVGIAFPIDFGFAFGLVGVGVITLGMQAYRKYLNLKLEGFWVFAGLLFFLGGIWELFAIKLHLVPVLIILAGVIMLVSAFRTMRPTK